MSLIAPSSCGMFVKLSKWQVQWTVVQLASRLLLPHPPFPTQPRHQRTPHRSSAEFIPSWRGVSTRTVLMAPSLFGRAVA